MASYNDEQPSGEEPYSLEYEYSKLELPMISRSDVRGDVALGLLSGEIVILAQYCAPFSPSTRRRRFKVGSGLSRGQKPRKHIEATK